jgi:TolA-binding protein
MAAQTFARSLVLAGSVILALGVGAARADQVWIQSGNGNPIAIPKVKVAGVDGDNLVFTTSVGKQNTKPLAQVPQIAMDDEPAFSNAEEAFRSKQYPAAVENYQKTLAFSTKDWVKARSALRLVQSANAAGNFPVAVQGFIQLVQSKPASATENKPPVPANGAAINQAIGELKQALQNARLGPDQKTVLNNYLVELYTAKGDTASANAAVGQMANSGAGAGAGAPADPLSQKVAADAKLTEARQAYSQRQYAKAAQVLNSSGPLFSDSAQRGEALYLLAQSTAAAATTNDANQLKDTALAYLRVVAACESLPGKPHVADSLLAVAATEEKLKNTKEAQAVYNQIVTEFPGTPAATRARESAGRLSAAAPKG